MLAPVTDETFAATVLMSEVPILVDFWAEWCPSCHRVSATLAELSTELDLSVVALNADENPGTVGTHRVLSLPTLVLFKAGEPVWRGVGARPKSALRQVLAEHLGVPRMA